jgi:hypothetical protein
MNKEIVKIPCKTCNNGSLIYSKVLNGMLCTNEYCKFNNADVNKARGDNQ